MRKAILIFSLLLIATISIHSQNIFEAKQNDFPELRGPYLGQKPPGMTPEIFAPGFISAEGLLEFGCTWSPDGKEFYFTRRGGKYQHNTIMVCRWNDSLWTKPEVVSFSDPYPKMSPRFFPDGSAIVYTAWRPPNQDTTGKSPFSLWITKRFNEEWKEPAFYQPWFSMSVSNNGTIFFHSNKGIGILKEENGTYQNPEILGDEINTGHFDQHPYVSPDGSYFVFDSHQPKGYGESDIYVAFRDKNNEWKTVVNLGEIINNSEPNFCPALSPDGKYLFYTCGEDIYWVSTKIIENLKPFN